MIDKTKKTVKIVYIPMAADILHRGHINIIKEGQKLGLVIIGLLTDEAITDYKRVPVMVYEERLAVVENIKGVHKVIPQTELDYRANLKKLKPDYFMHGTDWRTGVMSKPRQQAIETISKWGGELVEPEYTKGISSSDIINNIKNRKD